MVNLVALAQPAQDADGVFDRGLTNGHRLEAPLEGGILLDVLPVFVERGRADRVQFASGQHGLQHVGRIHRAFGCTGPHDGMQLVDEEHNPAVGLGDFFQDGLQAVLELTPVLRPGNQGAHVERDDPLVFQAFRHVAADDPLREAFDNGGLADAGFANQNRIVLGAARQHLDHPPHFFVAANHRVELALARQLGQVAAVLLERFVLGLGVLVGDPLAAADCGQRLKHLRPRDAIGLELIDRHGLAGLIQEAQQQVLGADVLVLHGLGFGLGRVEGHAQARGELRLAAAMRLGLLGQLGAHRAGHGRRLDFQLAKHARDNAVLLLGERRQQVFRLHLGVVHLRR